MQIGDSVMLGPDVMILGGDHRLDFLEDHMRFNSQENPDSKDILIEAGAWVGARTILLSGANVGEGAVVGAGSIVRGTIPPYCIAVGNQLRILRPRFQSRRDLSQMLKNVNSEYSLDYLLDIYDRLKMPITQA